MDDQQNEPQQDPAKPSALERAQAIAAGLPAVDDRPAVLQALADLAVAEQVAGLRADLRQVVHELGLVLEDGGGTTPEGFWSRYA